MVEREPFLVGKDRQFIGPVFVVGMPRSGTKLLRDILNNHSLIAITPNDSHCIPYFYRKIRKYGNLEDFSNFERFYNDFSETVFFRRLIQREEFIDVKSWYKAVTDWSYAGVIEAFYRSYVRKENKTIWGDKTPSYLLNLPLLDSLFPEAKFIHIIRDPRDYCLSINKAFGKNIYRAAQRWHDSVMKCRQDGRLLSSEKYFEIRYEGLVDLPIDAARSLCAFLNVPFEKNMTNLRKPVGKTEVGRDTLSVVSKNYGKWKNQLRERSVRKIEQICGPVMVELGYLNSCKYKGRRLSSTELLLYKTLDGLNMILLGIKSRGLGRLLRSMSKTTIHRVAWKAVKVVVFWFI